MGEKKPIIRRKHGTVLVRFRVLSKGTCTSIYNGCTWREGRTIGPGLKLLDVRRDSRAKRETDDGWDDGRIYRCSHNKRAGCVFRGDGDETTTPLFSSLDHSFSLSLATRPPVVSDEAREKRRRARAAPGRTDAAARRSSERDGPNSAGCDESVYMFVCEREREIMHRIINTVER